MKETLDSEVQAQNRDFPDVWTIQHLLILAILHFGFKVF
jgi:hypothetical protein